MSSFTDDELEYLRGTLGDLIPSHALNGFYNSFVLWTMAGSGVKVWLRKKSGGYEITIHNEGKRLILLDDINDVVSTMIVEIRSATATHQSHLDEHSLTTDDELRRLMQYRGGEL